MEMVLHLGTSALQRVLLVVAVVLSCLALALSGLPVVWQLLLIMMVSALSWHQHRRVVAVQRLTLKKYRGKSVDLADTEGAYPEGIHGTVLLADGRYLEVSLQSFCCLWWMQVLKLVAHDGRRTVVVLPDNCEASQQRQLRKLLCS